MRKFAVISLAFLLVITSFFGCAQSETESPDIPEPEELGVELNIVSTIFPQYDWVRQILGSRADDMKLTLLLNNRIDLHNYQPTVDDVVKIVNCDVFIYVGGESDEWVDGVLKQATNPDMVTINLLDILGDGAKIDEVLEGADSGHDHHHDDENDADQEHGYDEHIWLSLKNAMTLCEAIAEALSNLDADYSEYYSDNLDAYTAKLLALDSEYKTVLSAASVNTLLFADRFPFRYLLDDYGIHYYAAFSGCSAETEASFSTIVFLAKKVDELKLNSVMVTESADQSIALTVIGNTKEKNQKILVLDAMQSVTQSDMQNGTAYISIMRDNLNTLREALK